MFCFIKADTSIFAQLNVYIDILFVLINYVLKCNYSGFSNSQDTLQTGRIIKLYILINIYINMGNKWWSYVLPYCPAPWWIIWISTNSLRRGGRLDCKAFTASPFHTCSLSQCSRTFPTWTHVWMGTAIEIQEKCVLPPQDRVTYQGEDDRKAEPREACQGLRPSDATRFHVESASQYTWPGLRWPRICQCFLGDLNFFCLQTSSFFQQWLETGQTKT